MHLRPIKEQHRVHLNASFARAVTHSFRFLVGIDLYRLLTASLTIPRRLMGVYCSTYRNQYVLMRAELADVRFAPHPARIASLACTTLNIRVLPLLESNCLIRAPSSGLVQLLLLQRFL